MPRGVERHSINININTKTKNPSNHNPKPQSQNQKPQAHKLSYLIIWSPTQNSMEKFFDLFLFLFFLFFPIVRFVINNLRAEPKWNSSVFPSGNKTKKTTRKYNKIQTGRGGQHRGGHDTDSSTMLQISDSVNSFYAFRQNFCASSRLDCYENFRISPEFISWKLFVEEEGLARGGYETSLSPLEKCRLILLFCLCLSGQNKIKCAINRIMWKLWSTALSLDFSIICNDY